MAKLGKYKCVLCGKTTHGVYCQKCADKVHKQTFAKVSNVLLFSR